MARTSKTRIGGESGEQAERQIRAAESGAALKQRAHESLMQQETEGRRELLQGATAIGEMSERKKAREQQETQFSKEMALRKEQLGEQSKQAGAERAQQREIETGRQALSQQELDLRAAEKGYDRKPGAPESPLLTERGGTLKSELAREGLHVVTGREAKLQSEMARGGAQMQTQGVDGPPTPEQQRRADQMGRTDIERQGGQGGSFGLNEQGRAKMGIEATKAQANLIRAQAYQQQNQIAYSRAMRQGNQEEMKAVKQKLMAPVQSDRKLEEAFAKGEVNDSDWSKIESLAKDAPDAELAKEIKERMPGPRLRSFLSAATAKSSMQFIIGTEGELPDQIDLNNPNLRGFVKEVEKVGSMIGMLEKQANKVGASMTRWMGVNSYDDKLRLQNKLGAMSMMSGMNRIKTPAQATPAAPQPPQPPQQSEANQRDMREVRRNYGQEPGGRSVGEMLQNRP